MGARNKGIAASLPNAYMPLRCADTDLSLIHILRPRPGRGHPAGSRPDSQVFIPADHHTIQCPWRCNRICIRLHCHDRYEADQHRKYVLPQHIHRRARRRTGNGAVSYTHLGIYRGQRGRMEIRVDVKGVSCHGSAPERGDNAIYKMADILQDIRALNENDAEEGTEIKGLSLIHI